MERNWSKIGEHSSEWGKFFSLQTKLMKQENIRTSFAGSKVFRTCCTMFAKPASQFSALRVKKQKHHGQSCLLVDFRFPSQDLTGKRSQQQAIEPFFPILRGLLIIM